MVFLLNDTRLLIRIDFFLSFYDERKIWNLVRMEMLLCANFLVLILTHSQNSMKCNHSFSKNIQLFGGCKISFSWDTVCNTDEPYHFVSFHHTDYFILKTSRKGTDEYTIICLYILALIKLVKVFWKLLWLLNELENKPIFLQFIFAIFFCNLLQ